MEVKIEKGIPVPKRKVKHKYDFLSKLEVGDSVEIDLEGNRENKNIVGNLTRSYLNKQRLDIKVTVSDYNGKVRVWRVE